VSGNNSEFGATLQDRLLAVYYCLLLLEKNVAGAQKLTALTLRTWERLTNRQIDNLIGTLRDLCTMAREAIDDLEVALRVDD
jgi:hypothetical protein